LAHIAKTETRTLKRTERKMENTLGDQQGFKIGKGIWNATGMLRTISN